MEERTESGRGLTRRGLNRYTRPAATAPARPRRLRPQRFASTALCGHIGHRYCFISPTSSSSLRTSAKWTAPGAHGNACTRGSAVSVGRYTERPLGVQRAERKWKHTESLDACGTGGFLAHSMRGARGRRRRRSRSGVGTHRGIALNALLPGRLELRSTRGRKLCNDHTASSRSAPPLTPEA